jgi:type II secretion system protein I
MNRWSFRSTCDVTHPRRGGTPPRVSDRSVRGTGKRERGMPRPYGVASRGGFTLIEVLAAIVLVGIVVPVAMEAISLSMRSASDAKRKVEAAMLAENKLTELTAGLAMQSMGTGMAGGGATGGDFAPDWPEYRWESVRSEREVDLSEIQVRVIWTSRGEDRFVSLSTMVYTGTGATTDSESMGGTP